MQDYGGLVLPDHDLTPSDFKELARRLGRAAFVPLFLKFYERIVTGEATIEEQRRALADIGRWTGVEEDRKVDPNANLPVFNFVFGVGGRMDAQLLQPATTPLDAEELQIIEDFTHAQAPHASSEATAPPARPGEPPAPIAKRKRRSRNMPFSTGTLHLPDPLTEAAGPPALPEPSAPQVDTLASALARLDQALDGL